MKFRFCGDLDCPDWVLAEISTLSKITSIKMKLLCAQVVKDMLGTAIDYEKVNKLTADAKFESGDIKASIAALHFILTSAAKYSVSGEILSNELQQLGLPKEHSTAMCKLYEENLAKLQEEFQRQSFRLSYLESTEWRVDYVLSSSQSKDVNEACVQMRLKIRDPDTQQTDPVAFTVTADKFRVLLNELRQVDRLLEGMS